MNDVVEKLREVYGLWIHVIYSPDDDGWYWEREGETSELFPTEADAVRDFKDLVERQLEPR